MVKVYCNRCKNRINRNMNWKFEDAYKKELVVNIMRKVDDNYGDCWEDIDLCPDCLEKLKSIVTEFLGPVDEDQKS